MGYIQGEGRHQGNLFPVVLDDFVPADHVCRVINAFIEKLVMSELGFERQRPLRRDDLAMIRAIC
jgi:transposase